MCECVCVWYNSSGVIGQNLRRSTLNYHPPSIITEVKNLNLLIWFRRLTKGVCASQGKWEMKSGSFFDGGRERGKVLFKERYRNQVAISGIQQVNRDSVGTSVSDY